jgi:hypothetical protein
MIQMKKNHEIQKMNKIKEQGMPYLDKQQHDSWFVSSGQVDWVEATRAATPEPDQSQSSTLNCMICIIYKSKSSRDDCDIEIQLQGIYFPHK